MAWRSYDQNSRNIFQKFDSQSPKPFGKRLETSAEKENWDVYPIAVIERELEDD
jgi:hypothetical protein